MTVEKPKILIVGDEPGNHRVYVRISESLNIEIVKAISHVRTGGFGSGPDEVMAYYHELNG